MLNFLHYSSRLQGVRGNLTGLPSWARSILMLAALPGIALIALSIVAFVVSLSALLLLTLPVYRALRFVCAPSGGEEGESAGQDIYVTSGRRAIDVKIVE